MVPKSSQIFWSGNPSSQLAGYTSMKTSLAAICQDINPKISTIGTKLIRIHMSEVKCHLHLCSEALPDFLVGHHRWTQSTQIPSHKGMTHDDTWICHSSRQRSRKSNSNFTKSIAPVTLLRYNENQVISRDQLNSQEFSGSWNPWNKL